MWKTDRRGKKINRHLKKVTKVTKLCYNNPRFSILIKPLFDLYLIFVKEKS